MGFFAILMFSIATFINIAAIFKKIEYERFNDAIFDFAILVILGWIFSGSIMGLAIGTTTSAMMSVYLYFSPPDKIIKMIKDKMDEEMKEEIEEFEDCDNRTDLQKELDEKLWKKINEAMK